MTWRYSVDPPQFLRKVKKSFIHLIVPAIVIYILRTMVNMVHYYSNFSSLAYFKNYIADRLLTALFSSGVALSVGDKEIEAIGMPWFLVALFLGRTLPDFLHLQIQGKMLAVTCIVLSAIGVLGSKIQWLPFSFDIVLAIMPLLFMGGVLKMLQMEKRVWLKVGIYLAVWGITFSGTYFAAGNYMELAARRYPLYPLCFITAITGTLAVSELSIAGMKAPRIIRAFLFLGRNSIYLYCVHMMDYIWAVFWNIGSSTWIFAILRVIINIVVFMAVMGIIGCVRRLKARRADFIGGAEE